MSLSLPELLAHLTPYREWIFDLDNTLINQIDYDCHVFHAVEKSLLAQGYFCRGISDELMQHKRKMGPHYRHLYDDVLARYAINEEMRAAVIESSREVRPAFKAVSPVADFICRHALGRTLFIVTNGRTEVQQHKIYCFGLAPYFHDIVICDSRFPRRLKPSIWAWQELSAHWEFSEPVFVGDSVEIDGEFARNAGLDFVHFEYSV